MHSPEDNIGFEDEKPQHECGMALIASTAGNAALMACLVADELGNRGKEATGISILTADGSMKVIKGFGTAAKVFPEEARHNINNAYPSRAALAQTRYSTQGTKELEAAQPHNWKIEVNGRCVEMAHIHNGNLTNKAEVADRFGVDPASFHSDSELMGYCFSEGIREQLEKNPDQEVNVKHAVLDMLPFFRGAFTGAVLTGDTAVAYTDHNGVKPGVVGELTDGGVAVVSEVTGLDAIGANFDRETQPGEIITVDLATGEWLAEQWASPEDPKRCILEIFYFERPVGKAGTKAVFGGVEVEAARIRAGEVLAKTTTPVEGANFVFGIPASGVLSGKGYAKESGVPYNETAVTINSDYVGDRAFISPTEEQRRAVVRAKLNIDEQQVQGEVLLATDDTLVRGVTLNEFAEMCREAGATELHVRIAMALITGTCELGTDIGTLEELFANHYDDMAEMAQGLGLASLEFLEIVDILEKVIEHVAPGTKDHFCTGCLKGGKYPSSAPRLVHPYYHAA